LIVNTDTARSFEGNVAWKGRKILILDAETGHYTVKSEGNTTLQLAPAASTLMLLPENADVLPEGNPFVTKVLLKDTEVDSEGWAFRTAGLNSLPVSHWDFAIERKSMITKYTYSAFVHSSTNVRDLAIVLDDIELRSAIMGKMDISVSFNGRECDPAGWHVDKGFKKFKVDQLTKGRNDIKVTIRNAAWSGEPRLLTSNAVLLGRFGLKKPGQEWIIVPEPGEFRLDAWNCQGYPFYSGEAAYVKRVVLPDSANIVLELEAVDGCARLLIDGEDAGVRLWAPWKWEIPENKAGKEVELTLVVANTLANYLGEECRSGPKGRMWIRQYI
jgi:hypothetical protein